MLNQLPPKIINLAIYSLLLTALLFFWLASNTLGQGEEGQAQPYRLQGVTNAAQRVEIAGLGVIINIVGFGWLEIKATPDQVEALKARGYQVEPLTLALQNSPFAVYLPLIRDSGGQEDAEIQDYRVFGVADKFQRTEIARTGAAINGVGPDWVETEIGRSEDSDGCRSCRKPHRCEPLLGPEG